MIVADQPDRRSAKLVIVDADGGMRHLPRRNSGRCSSRATWLSQMMRQRCLRACTVPIAPAASRLRSGWRRGFRSAIRPNLSRSRSALVTFVRAPKIGRLPRLSHLAIGFLSDRWSRSLSGVSTIPVCSTPLLRRSRHNPARAGPSRASDPICARSRATGVVGRLDRIAPARLPSSRLQPVLRSTRVLWRLGANVGSASPRLPTPRYFLDRRSDARPTAPFRRTLSHSGTNGGLDRAGAMKNGRVVAIGTTWSARWSRRQRRGQRPRRRRRCERAYHP